MWTDTTRAIHARKGLALPSDMTDDEWAVLEPFLPPALPGGRPRKWPTRRLTSGRIGSPCCAMVAFRDKIVAWLTSYNRRAISRA